MGGWKGGGGNQLHDRENFELPLQSFLYKPKCRYWILYHLSSYRKRNYL